jgi:hypothetical protein
VPLLITSHKTPVGTLNLLADDQILIGANLSTISAFKAGKDVKIVKSIPVISDLINDYFDGDLTALNGIKVRQPGAAFLKQHGRRCARSLQVRHGHTQIWPKKLEAQQQFAQQEVHVQITQSCLWFLVTEL